MAVIAYSRVSTSGQDIDAQKMAIMEFAQREKILIDEFLDITISTRKRGQRTEFEKLIERMEEGDTLIISELTRAGRSLGGIVSHVETLINKRINFISIKEGLKIIEGKQDLQAKITVALFGLLGEVERDLLSQRTKEGIAKARAKGKKIGRPKGTKGKSKLDGCEKDITDMLDCGASMASIARRHGVSANTMRTFIKSRKLEAGELLKRM